MIETNVPSSTPSASSNAKSIYNREIANESRLKLQFYRENQLKNTPNLLFTLI
jgi:hypothetical protein